MRLEELKARRTELLEIARVHGASNVRLFGSTARGEARDASDVDFLVDVERGRSALDVASLLREWERALGRSVDLVEAACLHPLVRDRVLAEAVPL